MDGRVELVNTQEALLRPLVVQPRQGEIDPEVGKLQAQVLAGDRFERVGLVEDRHGVLGQKPKARRPQGQVADEQRMIDNQQVGVEHPAPGLVKEALLVSRAVAAQAVAVLALHGLPDGGARSKIQVRATAVAGSIRPEPDGGELVHVLGPLEQRILALDRDVQPPQADVVRPALDQHGGEFQARDRAEERDVLLEQLLLKRDRVGRDDDLFLELDRRLDCRDQVGEALAHAGPRLDHQVAGPLDRARDPLGHLDLLGAVFVGGQSSRDGATGAKDRNGIQICHARGHRAKRKSVFSTLEIRGVRRLIIPLREDATRHRPKTAEWPVLWPDAWIGSIPTRRANEGVAIRPQGLAALSAGTSGWSFSDAFQSAWNAQSRQPPEPAYY